MSPIEQPLGRAELRAALDAAPGPRVGEEDFLELWQLLDTDGDGVLSADELGGERR